MWNYIKKLFKLETKLTFEEEYERKLIEKVITLLRTKPDNFNIYVYSILNNKGTIQIEIKTGKIVKPILSYMTKKDKKTIKELIQPMVHKSKLKFIDELK